MLIPWQAAVASRQVVVVPLQVAVVPLQVVMVTWQMVMVPWQMVVVLVVTREDGHAGPLYGRKDKENHPSPSIPTPLPSPFLGARPGSRDKER